jgi:hypothetical protein
MVKTDLFRRSLDAMFYTGASRALAPLFRGIGAILTLHHIRLAARLRAQPQPRDHA